MNTLTLRSPEELRTHNLLSVVAHPDDLEMHHSAALSFANQSFAIIATDGEKTKLNFTNQVFESPEQIAQVRRIESIRSLAQLGIAATVYGELPDGELSNEPHFGALVDIIKQTVEKHDITAILTLGKYGFCGHSDHIATHQAAVVARDELRIEGTSLPLLALNHDHSGEFRVPVDRFKKLAAIACNATQFKVTKHGQVDRRFWNRERHQVYGPLLDSETFSLIV